MIERLLPPQVAAVETTADPEGVTLHESEEAVVANAVDTRRREFTTGRWCARRALAELGLTEVPIGSGDHREPLWPADVIGAVTHCTGYRAAALARSGDIAAIGIDAEPNKPCPGGVLDAVSSATERAMIARLAASDRTVAWDRLLFSAKESVYKAWFPRTHRWLGFGDVELAVDTAGTFTAGILLPETPVPTFHGRWTHDDDLVVTAVTVRAFG